MKKTNVALFLYFTAVLTALVLMTGCVAKHPKCAAYDKVDYDPMFKTNFERSIYK